MKLTGNILLVIQIVSALALIFIIAIQTTKSEQSGAGMGGWGTIGGQASTSFHKFGIEAQLTRITTWIALVFFAVSVLTAYLEAAIRSAGK